jgi:hypothetical protein
MMYFDPESEEWSPDVDYFVRLAPIPKNLKRLAILGVGMITAADKWHRVPGDVAQLFSQRLTNGYTLAAHQAHGAGGQYQLACDVARNSEEVEYVELYYVRKVAVQPGTPKRPANLKRFQKLSTKTKQTIVAALEPVPDRPTALPEPPAEPVVSVGSPVRFDADVTAEPKAPAPKPEPKASEPEPEQPPVLEAPTRKKKSRTSK